jgi:hypothetical protein
MNRPFHFCLLAVCTLIFGSLLLQAMPIPKKKPVPSVEGQMWISDEQLGSQLGIVEYTFFKDGKFEYRYKNTGATYTVGSWKQTGEDLYWECNDKYVEYNLKYKDGKFVGSAKNIRDLNWEITISPKTKD